MRNINKKEKTEFEYLVTYNLTKEDKHDDFKADVYKLYLNDECEINKAKDVKLPNTTINFIIDKMLTVEEMHENIINKLNDEYNIKRLVVVYINDGVWSAIDEQ